MPQRAREFFGRWKSCDLTNTSENECRATGGKAVLSDRPPSRHPSVDPRFFRILFRAKAQRRVTKILNYSGSGRMRTIASSTTLN